MKNTIVRMASVLTVVAVILIATAVMQWIPNAEAARGGRQACGGLQGLVCPSPRQVCVDDPRDNCDPKTGGADCIGICRGPGGGNTF